MCPLPPGLPMRDAQRSQASQAQAQVIMMQEWARARAGGRLPRVQANAHMGTWKCYQELISRRKRVALYIDLVFLGALVVRTVLDWVDWL